MVSLAFERTLACVELYHTIRQPGPRARWPHSRCSLDKIAAKLRLAVSPGVR